MLREFPRTSNYLYNLNQDHAAQMLDDEKYDWASGHPLLSSSGDPASVHVYPITQTPWEAWRYDIPLPETKNTMKDFQYMAEVKIESLMRAITSAEDVEDMAWVTPAGTICVPMQISWSAVAAIYAYNFDTDEVHDCSV